MNKFLLRVEKTEEENIFVVRYFKSKNGWVKTSETFEVKCIPMIIGKKSGDGFIQCELINKNEFEKILENNNVGNMHDYFAYHYFINNKIGGVCVLIKTIDKEDQFVFVHESLLHAKKSSVMKKLIDNIKNE